MLTRLAALPSRPLPAWMVGTTSRRAAMALIGLAAVLLAIDGYRAVLTWAWPLGYDDTYSILQQARSWAGGPDAGTPGGVTPGAWTLLLTLPHFFGTDALVFAKTAAVIASAAALAGVVMLAAGATQSWLVGVLAALLLARLPYFALAASAGHEDALFVAALVWGLVALQRWQANQGVAWRRLAIAAFVLLALTRDDGLVVALLVAAVSLPRSALVPWRRPVSWVLASSALFLLVRIVLDGDLLPELLPLSDSTYTVVRDLESQPPTGKSLTMLLRVHAPVLALAAGGLVFLPLGQPAIRPLAAVATLYVAVLAVRAPEMGLDTRGLMPVAIMLCVLAAALVRGALLRWRSAPWVVALLVATMALAHQIVSTHHELAMCPDTGPCPPGIQGLQHQQNRYHAQLQALPVALIPRLPADVTIAVSGGALGHHSSHRTIDLLALRRGALTIDDLLERRPDYVALWSRDPLGHDGVLPWENAIVADERFTEHYVRDAFLLGQGAHQMVVYRSRQAPPL